MSFPAIHLGDFTAERTVPLALLPSDAASGTNVRAIHLIYGEAFAPDQQNYWLLGVVILGNGVPRLLAQRSLVDAPRRLEFTDPLLVSRGDLLGCRLSPRGAPPPLSGLCAVVEYGSLSTNRAR